MNKLSAERRTAIVAALVEGNSIRSVCRITGTAKGTVLKLLAELGDACRAYHDATVRGVTVRRVQCDEIWSFCYSKARNVPDEKRGEAGDVWTWVGLDADTKLAVSWLVGPRDYESAEAFVRDIANRLATRTQLSTDGNTVYLQAVENVFGWAGVDYAMLRKIFGPAKGSGRYSPAECIGAEKVVIMGSPDEWHISTSFVERQNLTMRMQMRRFTRLTNGFSKKAENHAAAVALHFMHYNFCRVHQTLTKAAKGVYRTPAMAAGLTDRVWTVAELISLLESHK